MYKVVITSSEKVDSIDREYQKVADSGNERDKGPVYEYVEFPKKKTVTTEVYAQQVDDLDLKKVIDAVNHGGKESGE